MAWDEHATQHDCDNMQRAKKAVSYIAHGTSGFCYQASEYSVKFFFFCGGGGGIQIKDAL